MNSRYLLRFAGIAMASIVAGIAFAASDTVPLPTGNLAQLAYTDGQPALRALDKEIAAAGTDAAKLRAISERLLTELANPSLTEAARQAICQRLGTLLTADARPATDRRALELFERMVTNDREVEFARLALEPVPGDAIDQLFADALPNSRGRARLALLQAIGARRITGAVPAVARLLADPDADTSFIAAHTLAAIGTAPALQALESTPKAQALHVIAARLAVIGRLPAGQAVPALQKLAADSGLPAHVRAAATRMLLDADPAGAVARTVEALTGSDWTIKEAVVEAVALSKASSLVPTLAGRLPSFDPATQVAVIAALGRKGDAAAVPAIVASLKTTEPTVRAAAIEALGLLPGTRETVVALVDIAAGSGAEASLARQSLARMNGPKLDEVFLAGAQTGPAREQGVYIEQLGARNVPNSAALLNQFRKSGDPALRGAAALALRETAPASEQESLLAWATEATDPTELTRVLQALIAVTQRKQGADRSEPIIAAIKQAKPEVAVRLIPVLVRLNDPRAAAFAATLATGDDATLATAATGALTRSTEDIVLPHLISVAANAKTDANRRAAQLASLRLFERDQWWTGRLTRLARELLPTLQDDAMRKRLIASMHQARDADALTLLETLQSDPVVGSVAATSMEKILVGRGEKGKMATAGGSAATEWRPLFDGKSLNGWKANETAGVFTVENGMIKASGGRSHLFFVGPDEHATFRDFEFRAKVMTTPGSNSGIFFHTRYIESGWPGDGYEAQVNTTQSDRRKTGSLYAVQDVLDNAPSRDNEWFDYYIKVEGRRVIIKVNDQTTVDWTEPADWPTPDAPNRRLSSGTFALQGHDPKSTVYYKEIFVRGLPFTPRLPAAKQP